jgi:histidinol phosphatase-like enzyme
MLSRFEEEGCGMDLVLASTLDPTDQSATIREKSFRKPAPGMLLAAQEILNLNLRDSLLIGDRESDIEAGVNAGVGNLFLVNPDLVLDGNYESFEGLHECLVRLKEKFQ